MSDSGPPKIKLVTTSAPPPTSGNAAPAAPPPTVPQLKPPGAPGGLTLRPPGQTPAGASPAAPPTLKKPEAPATVVGLTLRKPGEAPEESRLAAPGPLTLKKPGEISAPPPTTETSKTAAAEAAAAPPSTMALRRPTVPGAAEENRGLQLRKPGEGAAAKPSSMNETSISLKPKEETAPAEDEEGVNQLTLRPSSVAGSAAKPATEGGLTLRKPKCAEEEPAKPAAAAGLSLRKPGGLNLQAKAGAAQSVALPPGLELPPDAGAPPAAAPSQPVPAADAEPPPPGEEPAAAESAPAEMTAAAGQISFARKKKEGLSKQTKITIAIFAVVAIPVCISGAIFLKSFAQTKARQNTPVPPDAPPAKQNSLKLGDKKAEETTAATAETQPAAQPQEEAKIPFPDVLAQQLEKEYGVEAKAVFLKEWETLTNEQRKSYLTEVGYPVDGKPAGEDKKEEAAPAAQP